MPERERIYQILLSGQEPTIKQIAAATGIPRKDVSKHLKHYQELGLAQKNGGHWRQVIR